VSIKEAPDPNSTQNQARGTPCPALCHFFCKSSPAHSMPRAQHSSSDDDDNSSDASSANLSWPLPTYHRGFPCVRLPFNKSVFVKTVKAANKRSLSATFYFEGVDEERLLEIASSLFPFPGQPVRFSKGDPFNKVVVRSMTYFADSTQSHAFYLLLTTDGLPHAISKFLAVAGKLRAKELLPKADFDKDTKLHAYFARLLLFHSVTERDLDASELRMKVLALSRARLLAPAHTLPRPAAGLDRAPPGVPDGSLVLHPALRRHPGALAAPRRLLRRHPQARRCCCSGGGGGVPAAQARCSGGGGGVLAAQACCCSAGGGGGGALPRPERDRGAP